MVPDLAASKSGGSVGTASLHVLDAPAAASTRSCLAGAGPGIKTCGPNGDDDCCKIATVPGGAAGAVQVARFDLGVYEVTSGRFAAFVDAVSGNMQLAATSGDWAGWKAEWTKHLPRSRADVDTELGAACQARSDVRDYGALTWPSADTIAAVDGLVTDATERAADIRADARADRLHQKPINCVSYWVAAAFCAWDGGRLPTADEWYYAAAGGDQLRKYPWGDDRTPDRYVTDFKVDSNSFTWPSDFPFFGNGMNAYHIAPPGRKPAGAGRWGHQDLGGNVLEWTSEAVSDQFAVVRGGSWEGHAAENTFTFANYPMTRTYGSLGMRCAYGPAPAPVVAATAVQPVDVFRGVAPGNDHLFGAVSGEGAPFYLAEGPAFRLVSPAPADSVPLHRCVAKNLHFLSNDPACEGYTSEGLLGYAYRRQVPTTLPLYRCVSLDGVDHVSTVTPAECDPSFGWRVEGTQGFVYGPPPSKYLDALYREALGRPVEEGGQIGWLGLTRHAGCNATSLAQLIDGVFGSAEFANRNLDPDAKVRALYRGGLSRDPEPAGLAGAKAALAGGTPWATVVHGLATSPEAAGLAASRCSP